MPCIGALTRVKDHVTFCIVTDADGSGLLIQFIYPEPISFHNQEKHWMDNSTNQQHYPIALSDSWRTKWLPNSQFIFLLEGAEANAANARALVKR